LNAISKILGSSADRARRKAAVPTLAPDASAGECNAGDCNCPEEPPRITIGVGSALTFAISDVFLHKTLLKFQILTKQIVTEPVQVLIHHRMILAWLCDGMTHAGIDKKFHGHTHFFQTTVKLRRI
jgi:hypothetical protein